MTDKKDKNVEVLVLDQIDRGDRDKNGKTIYLKKGEVATFSEKEAEALFEAGVVKFVNKKKQKHYEKQKEKEHPSIPKEKHKEKTAPSDAPEKVDAPTNPHES